MRILAAALWALAGLVLMVAARMWVFFTDLGWGMEPEWLIPSGLTGTGIALAWLASRLWSRGAHHSDL